jgi:hypothetical protein
LNADSGSGVAKVRFGDFFESVNGWSRVGGLIGEVLFDSGPGEEKLGYLSEGTSKMEFAFDY